MYVKQFRPTTYAGKSKVEVRQTSGDDLAWRNSVAEAVTRVGGLIVSNGSAIGRSASGATRRRRDDLAKTVANLTRRQTVWIGVPAVHFLSLVI